MKLQFGQIVGVINPPNMTNERSFKYIFIYGSDKNYAYGAYINSRVPPEIRDLTFKIEGSDHQFLAYDSWICVNLGIQKVELSTIKRKNGMNDYEVFSSLSQSEMSNLLSNITNNRSLPKSDKDLIIGYAPHFK